MSRYGNQVQDNPYWSDIKRANENLDKLTAKQQLFIQDMYRKGPGNIMSVPQIRWIGGIMRSVYK
jgi:hypothetical protein